MGRSSSSWHRLWLLVGVGAAALLAPAARAEDPLEVLRKTLKDGRWDAAAGDAGKLTTLSDLRRGYFLLSDATRQLDVSREVADKKAMEKLREQKKVLEKLRDNIGDKLVKRIAASAPGDSDRQIAACILIAETADADQPEQRHQDGKFASKLTHLLAAKDTGLVYHKEIAVRQAALHALGKITPKPGDAMPVLQSVLKGNELGPRRLAAYALTDLVKNAAFLPRAEEMATMNQAVAESVRVLGNPAEDESIRGYCLQTILTSARTFTDYRWTNSYHVTALTAEDRRPVHFEEMGKTWILNPDQQKLLRTYRDALPGILSALENDPSSNIRLTALETISQIIGARYEICERMQEKRDEKADAKQLSRSELLKEFNAPDPIEPLLSNEKWVVIANVLVKKTEDVQLKRGLMSLMERIAKDVEKTQPPATIRLFVEKVTAALSPAQDRFVRWSAARTLGTIAPGFIDAKVFVALGEMLADPSQRDPDLSAAAAETIEKLADARHATEAILGLQTAIADSNLDAGNRIAAMKALVAIGAAEPEGENEAQRRGRQFEANKAFPQVTSAVGSENAAVRREACRTLGQLGHPGPQDYADAIDALKNALRDDDAEVRLNASEAILSIARPK